MKKAVFGILLFACVAMTFAEKTVQQHPVTQFLTASDIDAFLRNHKAIKAELAAVGISENDFGFFFGIAPDFDTLNFLNSIKTPPKADAIFAKYGMGQNGLRKLYVMNWATEVAMLERAVQDESASPDGIDVSALGPIFEDMRKCINPEDRRLVLARCDELFAVFSEEEALISETNTETSFSEDDSDSDVDNEPEDVDSEPEDDEFDEEE